MPFQPRPDMLPRLWLLSDARNDAVLEAALARLPERSGFVFRHYHLDAAGRRERFEMLRSICRSKNHLCILSGDTDTGAAWHADGIYGAPETLGERAGLLRFATAHDADQIARSNRIGADAVFLSPVFPTRSHPEGEALGAARFHALAVQSTSPVIALGGMTAERARELNVARWAAIDGLS